MDQKEIVDILISVITISLAFSIPFFQDFFLILFTVGLGFVLHELGHKYTAIRYGCRAFYRMWIHGLVLALGLAVLTMGSIIFAAPGATYIHKQYLTRKENGIISLAGPMVNIILGFLFLWVAIATPWKDLGFLGFRVNLFLAFFNMMPIPPLDGSKVFGWNRGIWGIVFFFCMLFVFFPSLIL
jgi:Zn-dependent protease